MSPIWLIVLLINLAEASHMAYVMLRMKKRHMYMRQRHNPVATTALLISRPELPIIASAEGNLIAPSFLSSPEASELVEAFNSGDSEAYSSLLQSRVFISQSEALKLYQLVLSAEAWAFEGPLLQVCRPVLLSPGLAAFIIRNLQLLSHMNEVFTGEEANIWHQLLLQDVLMHRDLTPTDLRTLFRSVNVNMPLSNGYPLIFHLIYHQSIPFHYFQELLAVEELDLSAKPCVIGQFQAEWADLPLLLHALIYNYQAYDALRTKMYFQDILPTFDQILAILS